MVAVKVKGKQEFVMRAWKVRKGKIESEQKARAGDEALDVS
jgi:hypothetical protein